MAELLSELVARISVDATALKKGLANADKDLAKTGKTASKETRSIKENFLAVGKAATVMGASMTVAMTGMMMSFAKTGSELHDLSIKTGVSAKSLAGLKYAAEQNGASLGTVEMAIRRTASALVDADEGLAETKRAFDRMGISLQDIKGLKPEEQFLKIASAIANIPDPMTRAATAQDLFGRSGADLLPMLSEGADGLKKMMDEGVKLSGWSEDGANKADALGDAMDTLKTSMSGVYNAIASTLAPAITDIAKTITGVVGKVKEWIDANPQLAKALGTAVIVMGALATAIGVASLAVTYFGAVVNLQFGGILIILGLVVAGIVLVNEKLSESRKDVVKTAGEQIQSLEKIKQSVTEFYAKKKSEATADFESTKNKINQEYGIYEKLHRNKMDLARDASAKDKASKEEQIRNAREVHDLTLKNLNEEYNLKIRAIDLETGGMLSDIQKQIDAIDKQTSEEDLLLTRQDEQKRLRELEASGDTKALAEYQTEVERRELLRRRDAEKEKLRSDMDNIRTRAEAEKDRLEKELDQNIKTQNAEYAAINERLEKESIALDAALEADLIRLDKEREASLKNNETIYNDEVQRLKDTETALQTSLDNRIEDWKKYITDIQKYYDLQQPYKDRTAGGVPVAPPPMGWTGGNTPHGTPIPSPVPMPTPPIGGFASGPGWRALADGGVVTSPTFGLVGEAGPEAVIPLNEGWGQNIIINIESFTADSTRAIDTLAEKIVGKIRSRAGMRT